MTEDTLAPCVLGIEALGNSKSIQYTIQFAGRLWKLTVISTDSGGHSLLRPDDRIKTAPWPHYTVRKYPGKVTPELAVVLINDVLAAYITGVEHGKEEQLSLIRKTLGCQC